MKYLAEFLVWFVEVNIKRYKEDFLCSFWIDVGTVIPILIILLTGVGKCMNSALDRDNPPRIEQAAPAGHDGQVKALPLPTSP